MFSLYNHVSLIVEQTKCSEELALMYLYYMDGNYAFEDCPRCDDDDDDDPDGEKYANARIKWLANKCNTSEEVMSCVEMAALNAPGIYEEREREARRIRLEAAKAQRKKEKKILELKKKLAELESE